MFLETLVNHLYLYSDFYNTDSSEAALQW